MMPKYPGASSTASRPQPISGYAARWERGPNPVSPFRRLSLTAGNVVKPGLLISLDSRPYQLHQARF
jgi:hypothetical protein